MKVVRDAERKETVEDEQQSSPPLYPVALSESAEKRTAHMHRAFNAVKVAVQSHMPH